MFFNFAALPIFNVQPDKDMAQCSLRPTLTSSISMTGPLALVHVHACRLPWLPVVGWRPVVGWPGSCWQLAAARAQGPMDPPALQVLRAAHQQCIGCRGCRSGATGSEYQAQLPALGPGGPQWMEQRGASAVTLGDGCSSVAPLLH